MSEPETSLKTRILLHGCNGRMGQAISRICQESVDLEVTAGVDLVSKKMFDYPVFTDIADTSVDFDVIIDFSNPATGGVMAVIDYAAKKDKPVVIATTGLSSEMKDSYIGLSKKVPVFVSANMSIGINMLIQLVKKAASVLSPDFDIEIVEAHHNQKLDAPSGTALMIADAINETLDDSLEYTYDRHSKHAKRSSNEIGIHSIRGGTIVGEHSVYFAGGEEVLEIAHRAQSREVFARGAIAAAKFIVTQKPGLYDMSDLIGS
ncbi:MAG: 4-hydroxy-tetrahydrodipicolinate reductase [Saccharofermentanales bacterium]